MDPFGSALHPNWAIRRRSQKEMKARSRNKFQLSSSLVIKESISVVLKERLSARKAEIDDVSNNRRLFDDSCCYILTSIYETRLKKVTHATSRWHYFKFVPAGSVSCFIPIFSAMHLHVLQQP